MHFDQSLLSKAQKISNNLRKNNLKITFAESCTGGLLSAIFTEINGASDIFSYGFVTYSNQAKMDILGVKKGTLLKFGAVSKETVKEMSQGALIKTKSDIAIAISGIAGPNGSTQSKPVGLVYIGISTKNRLTTRKFNLTGDRSAIRKSSVILALEIAIPFINN